MSAFRVYKVYWPAAISLFPPSDQWMESASRCYTPVKPVNEPALIVPPSLGETIIKEARSRVRRVRNFGAFVCVFEAINVGRDGIECLFVYRWNWISNFIIESSEIRIVRLILKQTKNDCWTKVWNLVRSYSCSIPSLVKRIRASLGMTIVMTVKISMDGG